jgi:dCMP deaminase
MTNQERPDWQQYFMEIAHLVSLRSTCTRRRVGAVLVKDKRILATGYNGAPTGLEHCAAIGCLREKLQVPSGQRHELCRGLHAEQNAIIQAAAHGISIQGALLFCTTLPCSICLKMLINAGITDIVYEDGYADDLTQQLLREAAIAIKRFQPQGGRS